MPNSIIHYLIRHWKKKAIKQQGKKQVKAIEEQGEKQLVAQGHIKKKMIMLIPYKKNNKDNEIILRQK